MKAIRFDWVVLIAAASLIAAIGGVTLYGNYLGIGSGIVISAVSPANQSNPSSMTPIQIIFGQPMNKDSVQTRLTIQPAIQGSFRWQNNTLLLNPARPFFSNQTYNVSLKAGAETLSGQATIRPLSWSFHTRSPSVIYLTFGPEKSQNTLRTASLDGKTAQELWAAPNTIIDMEPSPDGLRVAVSLLNNTGKSAIWLISTTNNNNRQVINCAPSSCSDAVWSPNGKFLAYARNEPSPTKSTGQDRVWLYDLTTGQTQPAFEDNQVLGTLPTWSTNGQSLAFIDDNAGGIRTIDLISHQTAFIPNGLLSSPGSFSPDGQMLAFTKTIPIQGSFTTQVWLAKLGANVTFSPLPQSSASFIDNTPVWSPDGEWIAFLRSQKAVSHINQVYLASRNTGELVQVTNDANFANGEITWDITGQNLLIQRYQSDGKDTQPQVWAYNVSAGHLTHIVDDGLQAQWMP